MNKALSFTAIICVLASCADASRAMPEDAGVEIPSPAGDGSGEPFLSASEEGVFMSWLEPTSEGSNALMFAQLVGDDWSEPSVVAESDGFFVNWADFPSVTPDSEGTLWAHWLQRGEAGGYDYGVRIVNSRDGGETWSAPWTPHEDGTPTEHGFVSAIAMDGSIGFAWLDGRQSVEGPDGSLATKEMTVRWRTVNADGTRGPETLLDARVCDCCQTSAALTPSGPIVVYRDRSEDEIRDIYVTRNIDGAWTDGMPVHSDGWNIAGCPVNGPAATMAGSDLAVAWFTAADDVPHVKVAFSDDDGATFGEPFVVDDGNPAGRVHVLGRPDGSLFVTWLERTGGEAAEVRLRRYDRNGAQGDPVVVSNSTSARASGFPRMAEAPDGSLVVAWTDASAETPMVRLTRLVLEH